MRETRPNATVTTLLDTFLATNPDRGRSEREKEEIAVKYKPGDAVLPVDSSSSDSDDDDRSVVEEVRQLNLQVNGGGGDRRHRHSGRTRRSSSGARHAETSDAEDREEEGRSRRRRGEDREGRRRARHRASRSAAATGDVSEPSRHAPRIEHQSSLRSLLSLSDTETMEEEIVRQIIEEGLLDGINLDSLTPRQEDELSERIADAYRRRHQHRSHLRRAHEQRQVSQESPARPRVSSQSEQRPVSSPGQRRTRDIAHVTRPQFLELPSSRPRSSGHQRQLSEQSSRRRRLSPVNTRGPSVSETMIPPAPRLSSDMTSDQLRTAQTSRTGTRDSTTMRPRRATLSDQYRNAGGRVQDLRQQMVNGSVTGYSTPFSPLASSSFSPARSDVALVSGSAATGRVSPVSPVSRSRPSSSHTPRPTYYAEPSISCEHCGKKDIQYGVFKNCSKCKNGNFDICLRCYRLGKRCLSQNWPGASAWARYDRRPQSSYGQSTESGMAHTCILSSMKYQRPPVTAQYIETEGTQMTTDNPAGRIQTGLFCDICQSPANDCYWKCAQCNNKDDWGFCRRCVNQGRCCTHPLLPICHVLRSKSVPNDEQQQQQSPSSTETDPAAPVSVFSEGDERFKTLSIPTNCDICAHPIPASTTRFHCLECNEGDYDICANCYLRLVAMGKISKEHGHNGWRRCLRGHRMVVVGFEAHEEGLKRVVIRGLVGGYTLKDEYVIRQQQHQYHSTPTSPASIFASTAFTNSLTTISSPEFGTGSWTWREGSERRKKASRSRCSTVSFSAGSHGLSGANAGTGIASETDTETDTPVTARRFPPDGGVGLIVHARWSWFPEEEVKDELMFPRGAEITEAENINDDWFWGCYAGSLGLFPGGHVGVVGEVV